MIFEQIYNALRRMYQNHTQQELSKKWEMSQSHVNRLLSDESRIPKMELGTLFKIFPKATLNLSGEETQVQKVEKSVKIDYIKLEIDQLYNMLTRTEQTEVLTYLTEIVHSKNQRSAGVRGSQTA